MKYNIIANLFGSIFFILLPALLLPLYLKVLDPDRYGMFSLYFVILIYFKIIDFGCSSTFNRYIAQNLDNEFIRDLLKNFEILFIILSFIILSFTFIFYEYISVNWIIAENIKSKTISQSILVITIIASIKFFTSIYRAGLNGLEKQVWVNITRSIFEFISMFGGLIFIYIINSIKKFTYDFNISYLFIFFLFISFIELFFFRIKLLNFLPAKSKIGIFDFNPIKKVFAFMIMSASTTSTWLLVNWFDRLIFSGSLNLKYYGYYVTLTILSSVSLILIAPINGALLPRITNLMSQKKYEETKKYFNIIIMINMCIIFSICFIFQVFANEILVVWTGSSELANWGYNTLRIYSLGYGAIALTHTMTTYLVSVGKLKISTIMNLIWAPITIFLFYLAATYYDVFYAGVFWFLSNSVFLIFFLIITYNNFKGILNYINLMMNFIKLSFITIFMCFFLLNFKEFILFNNRVIMFLEISIIYFFVIFVCLLSIKSIRELFINYYLILYRRVIH